MRNRTGNGSIVSLTMVIALTTVCGGLGKKTNAQCETKYSASDGATQDRYGGTVSIDGDVIVVGAQGLYTSTHVPMLNVTLDLDQPTQAGEMMMTDDFGAVMWKIRVLNAGAGRTVWLQACQYELTTNVVATNIE